jgi:lipoyl(octanoyl) transferase
MDAFVYLDVPRTGLWNMAIDDAILERAGQHREIFLRVYQWSEPTLSLGYFQKYSDRTEIAEYNSLATVRRATGGGAILHHHEVTYSLALPQSATVLGAAPEIYVMVHSVVVEWLRELGLDASQWGVPAGLSDFPRLAKHQPFLCFHRRSIGDIVSGQFKLMGSAQRRSKTAILQHGSLLLSRSPYVPSLAGICQLLGRETQQDQRSQFASQLAQRLGSRISSVLDARLHDLAEISEEILSDARDRLEVFGDPQWLGRA